MSLAAPRSLLAVLACAALLLAWRISLLPMLGITLYVDEAQYWTWAQEMDWGFFSKPPGIAAMVWLSTRLFGDGLFGVKALAMLCYPAAALVAWAIARRLYDEGVALWSALALLTLPIFVWLGLFVSTDAPLTLCWTLALWAYLRAVDGDRLRDWLLLGLVCGLGLLSKYTMGAFLLAACLHLAVLDRRRLARPGPWLAAVLAVLLLSPNLVWNVAHDFPTLRHTADITLNKTHAGGAGALAEFWGAQWVAFGPLFGLGFLLVLSGARGAWRTPSTRLLLWFALPLWAVVSAQALKGGANANWAAPAFVPATIAVVAWLRASGRARWVGWGMALNLLLAALLAYWPALQARVAEPQGLLRSNPFARAQGWDGLGRALAPLVAAHPGLPLVANNRTLLAHMRYELRSLSPRAISWNPEGIAGDHYKLTTDLRPWIGHDVIFISDTPIDGGITSRFVSAEALGELHGAVPFKDDRRMWVYLLRDFRGY